MKTRRNSSSMIAIFIIAAGIILVLGSVYWYINPGGFSPTSPPTPSPDARIPFPEVSRVSLADAKAAYDTGSAVFVDVRGDPFYSQSHIPGALSLTSEDLPDRMDELDPNDWIITYCT